jgi:hypothetical protein
MRPAANTLIQSAIHCRYPNGSDRRRRSSANERTAAIAAKNDDSPTKATRPDMCVQTSPESPMASVTVASGHGIGLTLPNFNTAANTEISGGKNVTISK